MSPGFLNEATNYTLSNGTVVASTEKILFYTPSEIFKIEVAGGIAVVAVIILTYVAYAWYMARLHAWQRQNEIQQKIENGEMVDPNEMEANLPQGPNRILLFIVGALVMLAGIAVMFLP